MHTYLLEFGNLLLRWLHVIAAIAWIGESIYFVMLDNSLKSPRSMDAKKRGVFGEMWAVHGGGFYHNQKYLSNSPELPSDLHWSFWKAYTTWLSGFALFAVMYLAKPDFFLINPGSSWPWVATMAGWQASALAIAFLVIGWLAYDQLCRRLSPNMEHDGRLSFAVAIMMIAVAWLSTHVFQGRAAFLITGAVMATCMSANVLFWIIPGQRRMVNAMRTGSTPDRLDGLRGKQRSVHNTYFTLPVVFLMLSNHYSYTFTGKYAWIVMSLFIIAGAAIRQYFVLRHSGKNQLAYPIAGIALLMVIAWLAAPASSPSISPSSATLNSTAQTSKLATSGATAAIQKIIAARCIQCHAAQPTQAGIAAPPAGIVLESAQQIAQHIEQIKQTVASQYMPLGNLTKMTMQEREAVMKWQIN